MALAVGKRPLVDLAGGVDVTATALGLAGTELPDIFIAARQLQPALPVHQAGLPLAFVVEAAAVEVDARAFDTAVTDRAAILRVDRRGVVGRLALDAPQQQPA